MKKVIAMALALACLHRLAGCGSESGSDSTTLNQENQLQILVDVDETAGFTTIAPDQLGGNFENEITYLNVSNVNVQMDGEVYCLEDAIRDGKVTVEKIWAQAHTDARKGICEEKLTTQQGFAHITYRYPDFDFVLDTSFDVCRTPDGKQHLVCDFGIYHVSQS